MLKLFDKLALKVQKIADNRGYDIDNSIPYINACHLATLIEWGDKASNLRNWFEVFYLLNRTKVIIKERGK